VWKRINALFNWLPLSALIEGKILCMHGGIGRCINRIEQIAELERPITMEVRHQHGLHHSTLLLPPQAPLLKQFCVLNGRAFASPFDSPVCCAAPGRWSRADGLAVERPHHQRWCARRAAQSPWARPGHVWA